MQTGSVVAWASVAAILAGSLLYLLKRPHLNGEQKLVALLVSLSVSAPVGGLLMAPLYFLVWSLWWEHGISGATAEVVFLGPPAVVVGIAVIIAGKIADRREARKASEEQEIDGPSD